MRGLALVVLVTAGCTEPGVGTTERAVIGGSPTGNGMFPSVGALYDTTNNAFFCTGTLIAPDAILTAGHCIEAGAPAPSFTFDNDTRGAVTAVPGELTYVHPMFDINRAITDGPTQFYDVAIVTLATPITTVVPMVLPSRAEAARLTNGKMLTLVGYGQTVDGDAASAGVKYNGNAPIISASASELQIGTPGQVQNCYGDSGGPALVDLGAGVRAVGVVSRGATTSHNCTQGGVDTRVDFYVDWIRQHVGGACVGGEACAGGTEPPGPDPRYGEEITGGCATGNRTTGGSAIGLLVLALVRRRRR
jgi:V8-like Glu-specific endopeptidase